MSCRIWPRHFAAMILLCPPLLGTATAQTVTAEPEQARVYRNLSAVCLGDTARLCPLADQTSHNPRDQFLCLKVFRADLTLPCRKVVDALIAAARSHGF